LTPSHIQKFEGKPVLSVIGKGKKLRLIAIPQRLVDRLKSYAFEKKLDSHNHFFPIRRSRGWQIIKRASDRAGFTKRVFPHLLRHSDAIERLRQVPPTLMVFGGHYINEINGIFGPDPFPHGNKANARACDVLKLMKLAQNNVKRNFNINLEPEIKIWD
jgi:hypothetical protein